MDPISASLLVAAATGAGGEMGRQLWSALRGLVRTGPATGEAELTALSEDPQDMERARALSAALNRRAEQDPSFRAHLTHWQQQAHLLRTGDGDTHNTISGGTQSGPVVQGRDFSGITFNAPPPGDR
ncbi:MULTISPECIES: hypothetical protein [unclassified Streptomyces]|jgi:hypothetical protein|uniref:hypothetical protein n=1 Tax=unclassified Streptomyces TaxID=2593676 RepID=UPI00235B38E4|nr:MULTISPECIES: hypothetical protein [unclassified Streptomyces]MDH6450277.1 hypothetical protein [Streptomyces sp. SAI-119]MDH6499179.1 hypothetical protein [Streptomyces sp. SAI-149]GLP65736.1 hypothetical protein TUSST3_23560 [Streptomyces sp. TUS-ST3]